MKERRTILVVDDEPFVVKSVQDLLRLDFRVLGATSGAEGMAILEREEVQVVMTDQRMPEMTGVELLSRIRGEYPDAIRLLFTGYADIHAVIDAINQGNVFRYITKPWDPEELEAVVRQACEQYDLYVERKQLIVQLQEKNAALEQALVEVKKADELKSAFIQVASHELRTPLTILLLLLRLASQRAADTPLAPLVERITEASQRLRHLVDQMITMLAAGAFHQPLQSRAIDLAEILRAAADDVSPFLELRHQTLTVDVPADLGLFELDELKIRDMLNHLLLNAIKFTPDGGRITLATHSQAGDAARVQVSDTGVGIPSGDLPRIFDPFFTGLDVLGHSTGEFEFGRKGLGLGLSVVKSFAEMHGGRVDVESELDNGSTFTVTLPRRQG